MAARRAPFWSHTAAPAASTGHRHPKWAWKNTLGITSQTRTGFFKEAWYAKNIREKTRKINGNYKIKKEVKTRVLLDRHLTQGLP